MIRMILTLTLAAILLPFSGPAPAEPLGYSIASTELNVLDLATGSHSLHATLDTFRVGGLAMAPDGSLYSVSYFGDDLYRIDPQSGVASRIGSLGVEVEVDTGLTFDACGRLWLVTDGSLYEVDPASAATELVADFGERIVALTATGDQLVALVRIGTPRQLARIDPETGSLQLFGEPVSLPTSQVGLDFDADGGLWATYWMDGPIPGPWVSSIIRYEPNTGAVLNTLEIPQAQVSFLIGGNLAITPPGGVCGESVVAVPSSSAASRWTLVLLLASVGLVFLIRLR